MEGLNLHSASIPWLSPEALDADGIDNEVDCAVEHHQIIGKDVVVPLEIWTRV